MLVILGRLLFASLASNNFAFFLIRQGLSPYRRATYRYTPMIAFLLQVNIFLCASCGKFLFVLCDILAGYLIYKNIEKTDAGVRGALVSAQLWLFNPLTMVVSTRGNAESVMAVLVVGTLYLLKAGELFHIILSAVLYGLSVHMKIYPAVYAVALYMHINVRTNKGTTDTEDSVSWYRCIYPTFHSIIFGLTSFVTFMSITAVCYIW
jgi:GPI mannosyltransferase 1 subunit M